MMHMVVPLKTTWMVQNAALQAVMGIRQCDICSLRTKLVASMLRVMAQGTG